MGRQVIGGFEQMVLLAITRQGQGVTARQVAQELESCTGRSVSRGALYTTFRRLKNRGLLEWKVEPGAAQRGDLPSRVFSVTPDGLEVLRQTREILLQLWDGSEDLLGGQNP